MFRKLRNREVDSQLARHWVLPDLLLVFLPCSRHSFLTSMDLITKTSEVSSLSSDYIWPMGGNKRRLDGTEIVYWMLFGISCNPPPEIPTLPEGFCPAALVRFWILVIAPFICCLRFRGANVFQM